MFLDVEDSSGWDDSAMLQRNSRANTMHDTKEDNQIMSEELARARSASRMFVFFSVIIIRIRTAYKMHSNADLALRLGLLATAKLLNRRHACVSLSRFEVKKSQENHCV